MKVMRSCISIVAGILCVLAPASRAADTPPPVFQVQAPPTPLPVGATAPAASPAPPPSAPPARSAAELEKLAGPIALYPDPLVAIILPAAVYPVEIVQAARFVKDTNNLAKLKDQSWDANVKAVAEFPAVIQKLNDDLAWTVDLGQAFVDQPAELMEAIQSLRGKAQSAGTLQTTAQQIIIVTNAVVERTYQTQIVYVTNTIVQIAPANPQVIYVPQYNPTVVYAPPPPTVSPVAPLVTFGLGVAMGAIIANNCDWHYGGVYVGGGGFAVWGGGSRYPYYPPPPGYRPPPYYPPPGYRPPPPGYRPPGYPPPGYRPPTGGYPPGSYPPGGRPPGAYPTPRPTTMPANAAATPGTGQRWQADSSRLNTAGASTAPANLQTREARGWGSGVSQPGASTTGGFGTGSGTPRPATGAATRPAPTTPGASRPAPGPSISQPAASPNRNFNTPQSRPASSSSAFRGGSGSAQTKDFSSRGAASRGGGAKAGGGGGGGGRRR